MVTVNRCLWWGQQYVAWEKLHGFNWPTMVCSLLSIISLPWISLTLSLKVLVAHSCLTLCNPMDWSLPGSSVHGILHARILEWVAMPSSRGSSQPRDRTQVSLIAGRFFTQNSIPILNFFRPESPVSPALASGFFITETLGKPLPPHQMMLIGICLN